MKSDIKNQDQFIPRTANVLTYEKTGLAIINKQDYLRVLKVEEDKEIS